MKKTQTVAFANLIGSIFFIILGIWAWLQTGKFEEVKNSFVQGVQQGDRMVVSRLISTDPHMYLDPQYAPGNLVRRSFGARPKLQ